MGKGDFMKFEFKMSFGGRDVQYCNRIGLYIDGLV